MHIASDENMNKVNSRSSLQAVTICLSVLILKSEQCSALECNQTGKIPTMVYTVLWSNVICSLIYYFSYFSKIQTFFASTWELTSIVLFPTGPNGNGIECRETNTQPAIDPGVVGLIVVYITVAILLVIAALASVCLYVMVKNIRSSENANWCTTVRGVTREDTGTVNQPAVYETIPEELVQTFTKNEAYVTQESAVMTRNEAYTTLSLVTRGVLSNDENTEYEVVDP